MIRTLSSLCLLLALGCGADPAAHLDPLEPVARDEPTPAVERAVPADFRVAQSGGPVARWMAAGMTLTHSHLEPHATEPGRFEFVTIEVTVDEMGMDGESREISRVAVDDAAVRALYALILDRRAELDAPCFDPTIMDGGTSGFQVHMDGADHSFSCTNASSPAFDALAEAYRRAVPAEAS